MGENQRKLARSSVEDLLEAMYHSARSPFGQADQVYPGIYIGGLDAAQDIEFLTRLGITHILNAAFEEYGRFMTNEEYYKSKNFNCKFLGVAAIDDPQFQLHPFFCEAAEFVDSALRSNGKVLVHCVMGISRSASLVLAYLIIKKNMSVSESLQLVRGRRDVFPNEGFIKQLVDLENRLISQNESAWSRLCTIL